MSHTGKHHFFFIVAGTQFRFRVLTAFLQVLTARWFSDDIRHVPGQSAPGRPRESLFAHLHPLRA